MFNKDDQVKIVNKKSPFCGYTGKISRITRWGKYNVECLLPYGDWGFRENLLPDEIQIQDSCFTGLYTDDEIELVNNKKENKRMQIINLTPHTITVVNAENEIIRQYPSAGVARAKTIAERINEVDGIPVMATTFGDVEGLPEPQDGVTYIVSMVVAQAARYRADVVAPDTGPTAYRHAEGPQKGQIIGVRAFVRY
jgi:hypothetical protein